MSPPRAATALLLAACVPPTREPVGWSEGLDARRVEVACAPTSDLPARRVCPECGFRFHHPPRAPAPAALDACLGGAEDPPSIAVPTPEPSPGPWSYDWGAPERVVSRSDPATE